MKRNVVTLLAGILLSISLMGSSCVHDGFLVSVNLNPIVARFKLGTGTVFGATTTVKLDSLVPAQYKNKLRQGRIYDFKVRVEGEYEGNVAGVAYISVDSAEGLPILKFPETGTVAWSVFYTPQSLLGKSPHLSPQSEGIDRLLHALTARPLPSVTVSALGMLGSTPTANNLYVSIELYLQADADLN